MFKKELVSPIFGSSERIILPQSYHAVLAAKLVPHINSTSGLLTAHFPDELESALAEHHLDGFGMLDNLEINSMRKYPDREIALMRKQIFTERNEAGAVASILSLKQNMLVLSGFANSEAKDMLMQEASKRLQALFLRVDCGDIQKIKSDFATYAFLDKLSFDICISGHVTRSSPLGSSDKADTISYCVSNDNGFPEVSMYPWPFRDHSVHLIMHGYRA